MKSNYQQNLAKVNTEARKSLGNQVKTEAAQSLTNFKNVNLAKLQILLMKS